MPTKEKQRTPQTVERELEEVRSRLSEMRSELASAHEPPAISWEGVSPETLEELSQADKKRATLPAVIALGEIRELELRLELVKLQQPEARREIERRYEVLQKAEAELQEAQERRNAARFAWNDEMDRGRGLVAEEHRLEREIAERKARAAHSRERLAAPVVRSLWQQGSTA